MKVTLHIGSEKTGTTSIQRVLAKDRAALKDRGILFPKLFGSENHMEVAVAAMAPNSGDELQMIELGRQKCSHAEYRDRLRDQIRDEVAQGDYDRILISNEHCHSRVRMPDAVHRLIELFDLSPENFEVIVYLRRQDRLAVSLHSTVLKLGGRQKLFPDIIPGAAPHYYQFNRLANMYAGVVGPDRVKVRLYERSRLDGGDVVSDFYSAADLGITPSEAPKANSSVSAAQGAFLQQFNERFPLVVDGKINPDRGDIFNAIRETCTGRPFRPARKDAKTFYEPFRDENARLKARFLPDLDRATLFDEDFSEYPEHVDSTELSNAQMFDFVSAIWRHRRAKV